MIQAGAQFIILYDICFYFWHSHQWKPSNLIYMRRIPGGEIHFYTLSINVCFIRMSNLTNIFSNASFNKSKRPFERVVLCQENKDISLPSGIISIYTYSFISCIYDDFLLSYVYSLCKVSNFFLQ